MKYLFLILSVFSLLNCSFPIKENKKQVILKASREAPLGWVYLTIYSDSTFTFTNSGIRIQKKYNGKAVISHDTILFNYFDSVPYAGTISTFHPKAIQYLNGKSNECLTINKFNIDSPLKSKAPIPFFKFDSLVHYNSNAPQSVELIDIDGPKDKIENAQFRTLLDPEIKSLNDSIDFQLLDDAGFKNFKISKSLHPSIQNIFSEKDNDDVWTASCIPVYRDFLFFYEKSKLSGIAIICFTCQNHQIIGTNRSITNFGGDGDYQKLVTLLKENH